MLLALIPAAGHSRRMGRAKLSLPVAGRSVLGWVVEAFRRGGVEETLVVVGPHVADLAPLAREAGAHVHLLDEETPDMRATIEQGLQWLEEHFQPRPEDAWLLAPADHPLLEPEVVATLLRAHAEHPECSILVPTHAGKRGHPVLIRWSHVAGIRRHPANLGLNTYLRQYTSETLEIPFASDAVLVDLDLPEDYERLCRRWQGSEGA